MSNDNTNDGQNKNYLPVIIFTVAMGIYLVGDIKGWFKSSKDTTDESASEKIVRKSHTESTSSSSSVHEAPKGYKRGSSCSDCNGLGRIDWKGYDAVCAGCNGKGYRWVKEN